MPKIIYLTTVIKQVLQKKGIENAEPLAEEIIEKLFNFIITKGRVQDEYK